MRENRMWLPQNKVHSTIKYAIGTKTDLYGFDFELNRFIQIPVIDEESKRNIVLSHGNSSFHD